MHCASTMQNTGITLNGLILMAEMKEGGERREEKEEDGGEIVIEGFRKLGSGIL